jgi:hypothetical protein
VSTGLNQLFRPINQSHIYDSAHPIIYVPRNARITHKFSEGSTKVNESLSGAVPFWASFRKLPNAVRAYAPKARFDPHHHVIRKFQPRFFVCRATQINRRTLTARNGCRCISVGTRKGYSITNCDPFGRVYTMSENGAFESLYVD